MKTKHTPGKWYASYIKISQVANRQHYFSIMTSLPANNNKEYVMPGFYYPHSKQSIEEMEANAKLIAAAPELLAHLMNAPSHSQSPDLWEDWETKRLALIAKATM